MSRPTDETLMGFADGALSEEDRAAVERYLAGDAEARALVQAYQRTASLAKGAFDEAFSTPPPSALVEMILSSKPAPARGNRNTSPPVAHNDNVITFKRFEWRSNLAGLPIAASIALVAGLSAGLVLARLSDPAPVLALGPQPAGSVLTELLEQAPTGERRDRLVVMATFRDRLDRPCREIEVLAEAPANVPSMAGVACRHRDGTWIVEGAARVAQSTTDQGYVPSGARETDALGSLLTLLGAKPVLTPSEEGGLISRKWE